MSDEIKREQSETPDEAGEHLSDQQLEEASGGIEAYDFPGQYSVKFDDEDLKRGSSHETRIEKKIR